MTLTSGRSRAQQTSDANYLALYGLAGGQLWRLASKSTRRVTVCGVRASAPGDASPDHLNGIVPIEKGC